MIAAWVRALGVADGVDARLEVSTDQALAELRRCAGTRFDPAIVQAFERATADHAQLLSADRIA